MHKADNRYRILFLRLSPEGIGNEALVAQDTEINNIRDAVQGDCFWVEDPQRMDLEELKHKIDEVRPNIIHISGHGSTYEISFADYWNAVFQGKSQGTIDLGLDGIKALLGGDPETKPRILFINACFADDIASELRDTFGCTIGMENAIHQDLALTTAKVFYRKIAEGKTLGEAIDDLKNEIFITARNRGLEGQGINPSPQIYGDASIKFDRSLNIDWHEVSKQLLEQQRSLTTNPITLGAGITYQVEQVYVPLGLMERKKVPRRNQDISPEQGSALYQKGIKTEEEITQEFEHEQFLDQVLLQGQSPKSEGKRIAIIGEPGAGKTTLLQQIAQWMLAKVPESIVIWISLASLQNDELETYLENQWLKSVIRRTGGVEVSEPDKRNFVSQLQQGRVWLLLDGLDEMQVKNANPLSVIQKQIQEGEWVQQTKIVLTCRLNMWDGNRNALDQFDTYRTLEFASQTQVEEFIKKWFTQKGSAHIQQGEKLCEVLREPGKDRIRDLVKNPLRLTLLCFDWSQKDGSLPDTQAELYQRFVNRVYEWNEKLYVGDEKQKELNQALAKLALAAIDDQDEQGNARFRLRANFVQDFLNESLFNLALKLGWLNQIGVDADAPDQKVYAFYHPTFEEYFAALGVDDWQFFLKHTPRNLDSPDASYRVFEPQWKQVFLFWLGCKDSKLKEQKKSLIQSLVNFQDGCEGFYNARALLLAVLGFTQFRDYEQTDEIIKQLVHLVHPNIDAFNQEKKYHVKLSNSAAARIARDWSMTALSNTDSQRVIKVLVEGLNNTEDKNDRQNLAETLGKIDPGNEIAIQTLISTLRINRNENTRWQPVFSLIKTVTSIDMPKFVGMFKQALHWVELSNAVNVLGEIGNGNETAIRTLLQVVKATGNIFACNALVKIASKNKTAIEALTQLIQTAQDEDLRWKAAWCLDNIDPGNKIAIEALTQLIQTAQDEDLRWRASETLGIIDPGNKTAIEALTQLIQIAQDEDLRWKAFKTLGIIDSGNKTAIEALTQLIQTAQDEDLRWKAAWCLDNIDPGNKMAIEALTQLIQIAQDKDLRRKASETLGNIDPGNKIAIEALTQLIQTAQDEDLRRKASETLGEIDPGNKIAIEALTQLIQTAQDEDLRRKASETLGEIGLSNEIAIETMVQVLKTARNGDTIRSVAETLDKIDPGDNRMRIWERVQVLCRHLDKSKIPNLMMKCAESLSYSEFYQAFHSSR